MKPSSDIFIGSRENIKRAQRKFDELKGSINRYLAANPYSIRVERQAHGTYVIARREADLPIDIAFDVVEIVGRLRAALDKSVVCLAELNGRGTSGVGFPFGGVNGQTGQPEPFPSERMVGKYGLKKKLTPAQWSFIEAQRPYPGGNDTLWAVNEIANTDKHRKDLVTAHPDLSHRFGVMPDSSGSLFIDRMHARPADANHVLRDQEREVVLLALGPVAAKARIDHEFAVSVVFGGIRPVAGKNVLVTLNEQIRAVDYVSKGLARLA